MKRTVLGSIILVALSCPLEACFEAKEDATELTCRPGLGEVCYTGPAETRGVGVCHAGISLCVEENGVAEESCTWELTPQDETCDNLDNDCDGIVDNNGACAHETMTELSHATGPLNLLWKDEFLGPYLMISPKWDTTFCCPKELVDEECASYFIDRYGAAYGVMSREEQLDRVAGTGGQVGPYLFKQVHMGIEVEGGFLSLVVRGNVIHIVMSTMLAVRADFAVEPQLDKQAALEVAQNQDAAAIEANLLVYTLRNEDGMLPPRDEQQQLLAYRVMSSDKIQYVDANCGAVIAEYTRLMQDLQVMVDPTSQPEGADAQAALGEFYAYLIDDDVFDVDNHAAASNDGAGGHFNLHFAHDDSTTDYCSNTTAGITCNGCVDCSPGSGSFSGCEDCCAACASGNDIYFCENGYDLETLLHESGHNVFLQHFSGTDVHGNSMDEMLTMFHTELYECSRAAAGSTVHVCDWVHNGFRDFSAMPPSLDFSNDRRDIYENAMIPGHAFYLVGETFRKSLEDDPLANRKLRYLYYHMVRYHMAPYNELPDAFACAFSACIDLRTSEAAPYSYTMDDCNAVRSAFATVELTDCAFPSLFELCNGLDDDCDGFIDENADYDPLSIPCYTGPPARLNVGECHHGYRECSSTQDPADCHVGELPAGLGACYSAQCLNQGLPQTVDGGGNVGCDPDDPVDQSNGCEYEEVECDGLDNDCDSYVDEYLKIPHARDADNDGYGDPSTPHQDLCPGDGLDGWIEYDPTVPDDCDDTNPAIRPGAEECPGPNGEGDGIDNNCVDGVDEYCHCNPMVDLPTLCGPVTADCIGVAWDHNSVCQPGDPASTVGAFPACKSGLSKCQWVSWEQKYLRICTSAEYGGPEVCNGKDDDCDDQIDENVIDAGICGIGGTETCQGGQIVCVGAQEPNACGGVAGLAGMPGEPCDSEGGIWLCKGPNEVLCLENQDKVLDSFIVVFEQSGYTGPYAYVPYSDICWDLGSEPLVMSDEASAIKVYNAQGQTIRLNEHNNCADMSGLWCHITPDSHKFQIKLSDLTKGYASGIGTCSNSGSPSLDNKLSSVRWVE